MSVDMDRIIEEKRKELTEDVKKEVKGLEKGIVDDALQRFATFEETLKMAYSAKVVGPEDLLRVIEKEGFVYRGVVYVKEWGRQESMGIEYFLENLGNDLRLRSAAGGKVFGGKQLVTVIIEPLGGT